MVDLIYLTNGRMILAKQRQNWQDWQDKLDDYMTHITFADVAQCADFIVQDFVWRPMAT